MTLRVIMSLCGRMQGLPTHTLVWGQTNVRADTLIGAVTHRCGSKFASHTNKDRPKFSPNKNFPAVLGKDSTGKFGSRK